MDKRKSILSGAIAAATYHQELLKSGFSVIKNGRVDIESAINQAGIALMYQPLQNILGFCIHEEIQGILVTTERPASVRRFTAAHELGHILMDHHGSIDKEENIIEYLDINAIENPELELSANSFASEFMQPRKLVVENLRNANIRRKEELDQFAAYGLSLKLGLSYKAVCWGLHSNKLIDYNHVNQLVRITPKSIKEDILHDVRLKNYYSDVWRVLPKNISTIYGSYQDVIQIELQENPSTGYIWDFSELSESFQILSEDRYFADKAYGAGQTVKVVAQNTRPGILTASLYEKRPWLGDKGVKTKIEISGSFEETKTGLSDDFRQSEMGVA